MKAIKEAYELRKAAHLRGPFVLSNSRGEHVIQSIRKVNSRLYELRCTDGSWFALPPDYMVYTKSRQSSRERLN